MEEALGLTGVFAVYSLGALLAAASSALFLPETREKSHEDVARELRGRTIFLGKGNEIVFSE